MRYDMPATFLAYKKRVHNILDSSFNYVYYRNQTEYYDTVQMKSNGIIKIIMLNL